MYTLYYSPIFLVAASLLMLYCLAVSSCLCASTVTRRTVFVGGVLVSVGQHGVGSATASSLLEWSKSSSSFIKSEIVSRVGLYYWALLLIIVSDIGLVEGKTAKKKVKKETKLQVGNPLPDEGTCTHYKKSRRWLRYESVNNLCQYTVLMNEWLNPYQSFITGSHVVGRLTLVIHVMIRLRIMWWREPTEWYVATALKNRCTMILTPNPPIFTITSHAVYSNTQQKIHVYYVVQEWPQHPKPPTGKGVRAVATRGKWTSMHGTFHSVHVVLC